MNGGEGADLGGGAVCDGIDDRLRMGGWLLALQAWRSSNEQVRDKLSSFARRISVAIDQYERRRFNGVRSIDAGDYLEGLRRHIVAETTGAGDRAQRLFSCEMGALSNEGALLLGLIVNEVVADAIEHDLCAKAPSVALRLDNGPSGFCLSVVDRRSRRPPWSWASGFGLTLVRWLVQDSADSFTSEPYDAGVRLHVLLARGERASHLRNVSPSRSRAGSYDHLARLTQDASHERRHG